MTDSISTLLATCDARDIRLTLAGQNGLRIDAPRGAVPPDFRDRLMAHKTELLDVLRTTMDGTDIGPRVIWSEGLRSLEGDPLFPSDILEALRTADVRWEREVAGPSSRVNQSNKKGVL